MTQLHELIICEYCDAGYHRIPLLRHQSARCTRCGDVLYLVNSLSVEQRLALSVTGGELLIFANAYPVMSISMNGISNSATRFRRALPTALHVAQQVEISRCIRSW